jgi:hypothetical protein
MNDAFVGFLLIVRKCMVQTAKKWNNLFLFSADCRYSDHCLTIQNTHNTLHTAGT